MNTLTVQKKVLKNGLAVLVLENRHIPKVSSQLWYNVGSKHEKSGQKGIAHFIEHMIFKGTDKLSESDINLITHKLSGSCNAFTSYDYTGYLFDFPSSVWHEALPIMADCMKNCTFKQQFLNSEVKAVIQELKMYNDDYLSTLIEKMIGVMFTDHPYHHPIIGYKHDLWSLNREALVDFYQEHYIPNNAALIVVGDVSASDVFAQAEAAFGHIQPTLSYKTEQFYHDQDLAGGQTTLYREIQKPFFTFAFVVPGLNQKMDYTLDCLTWIIGAGKGSRLYKKLVEERHIASDVNCFVYDLFDHSILFIQVDPYRVTDKEVIQSLILQELTKLRQDELNEQELTRAIKKTEMDFLSLQENNQKLAYIIGKYYTALRDENYLSAYCTVSREQLKKEISYIAQNYLSPALCYFGQVLPVEKADKKLWLTYQEKSDEQDARVLAAITREADVEQGSSVHNLPAYTPVDFKYPEVTKKKLPNGLKILYHHDPSLSKIEVIVDFKGKYFYDPEDRQGLTMVLYDMLEEGTRSYSSMELAQIIDSKGMTLSTFPGVATLSMLAADIKQGFTLLREVLCEPTFPEAALERVKSRILADVDDFWDDPQQFIGQLVRQEVYDHHPYHKSLFGTHETIAAITYQEVKDWYARMVTPQETRISVVGDLTGINIEAEIEKIFGSWSGAVVPDMRFPHLPTIKAHTIKYPIVRDQITLAFAGISVTRKDADYDKLLLFDQVFSGGMLGSMSSRLFELRERSGLFYTIGGSLVVNADQQPGIVYIKTIVSPDRLEEAKRSIAQVIKAGAQGLTQEELNESVRAIMSSLIDHFSALKKIASTILFMDTFDLDAKFFNNRYDQLSQVTIKDIQDTVGKYMNLDQMVTIEVGRV